VCSQSAWLYGIEAPVLGTARALHWRFWLAAVVSRQM